MDFDKFQIQRDRTFEPPSLLKNVSLVLRGYGCSDPPAVIETEL